MKRATPKNVARIVEYLATTKTATHSEYWYESVDLGRDIWTVFVASDFAYNAAKQH